jgi:serine/threonine protein kinase
VKIVTTPPDFLLSKYESVGLIDEGADGSVYKCVRQRTTTAVKVLANPLDSVARARFDQEVQILKRLDNPHVVKLLDAGETDGHPWLESEYARESHFGRMFPYLNYSNVQRQNCFVQICLGVLALHEAEPPIVHRDLKPRNILVFDHPERKSEPILKIADFGLSAIAGDDSHLTTSGQVLGTGLYMAPERLLNPFLKTPQSDIYSLGITFIEACTGQPTMGENIENVPEVFRAIVTRMTRHKAPDRYQTVREVLTDLQNLSLFRLIYGREIEEGEVPGPSFSTNTAGQLARIIEVMYDATAETISLHVTRLEEALDSLGSDVHDHKAYTIGNIPHHVAKLIDDVMPERLCRLIETFDYAAERTKEGDFFFDSGDRWSLFLVGTIKVCSYGPTKHACLYSLSKILVRFDTPCVRQNVGHIIYVTKDPSDLQHFAQCLRERGREDIAKLLDGVPEDRELDVEALKSALRLLGP